MTRRHVRPDEFDAPADAASRYADEPRRAAETLSSMASWIERAQKQLDEAAAATRRMETVAQEPGPQAMDATDALAAIRRIEERLGARNATPASPAEPRRSDGGARGFEANRDRGRDDQDATPRMPGRRPLKLGQTLRGAVDDIRNHLERLESETPSARRSSGLPGLGTLARSQTAMLTTLKDEVAKLARHLDELPAQRPGDQKIEREVETLRHAMSEVARRDDLSRLERGLQSLTDDIVELRRAGTRSVAAEEMAEEMAALQAEIRSLARQNNGPALAAIQTDLKRLVEHAPSTADLEPIFRDIEQLSRKVDFVAERAGEPVGIDFEPVIREIQGLARTCERMAEDRTAPASIDALSERIDHLREMLAEQGVSHRDMERAVRGFGQPIEQTLAALVEKIERVERRVSDPEALDQLERQIEMLAMRIGDGPSRDPGLAGLERTMTDLLEQVAAWRHGAAEVAEHAARTAIAETIDSMPVAAEVERHLVDFGDRYAASEERTRHSLSAVETSLSDVMARLASLESGTARTEPSAPAHPAAPEPRAAAPARLPAIEAPPAPPAGEDILLEPGAARPTAGRSHLAGIRSARQDAAPAALPLADLPDIKSSFIAAARRAAQAAAAESQAAEDGSSAAKPDARGTGVSPDIAGRSRRPTDTKRRPLLLAAAAIVLALGTMQMARLQFAETDAAPATTTPAPERPTASQAAPAETAPKSGPVLAAAPPASIPADPTTTQSITPAQPAAPPAAGAAPAETGAAKEPGRVGEPAAPASAPAKSAAIGDSSNVLPAGLRQAADRGDPIALYELAARTADGRGVGRDSKLATSLFEKAAEKGLAPAQYRLGNAYERGIGVTRDIEQAKSWYRRAAIGGNVRAMHNLAVLLADGGGVKPDYAGAVEWFSKAAEHGVKDSQFNLAVLHARGLGTAQDFSRAYHWLAIAARQGDDDAARKRDEVGQRLSAQDLARAKAGADTWKATPAGVGANEVLVPPGGFAEQQPAAQPAAQPAPASKQAISASRRTTREARL